MRPVDRMETAELIERFIQAAEGYEQEIKDGTVRKANRHTATGDRIVEELKRRGAEQALLGLFDHPIPIVRGKAAIYALRFAPEAAVPVLKDISENVRGIPASNAWSALFFFKHENISWMSISELLDQFTYDANGYWHAVQGFEGANEAILAEAASRCTSSAHDVIDELERRGAEHELLPLFEHPSPMVRVWAARHALGFAPDSAVPVLEDILRHEEGIPAMEAKAALQEWREEEKPN